MDPDPPAKQHGWSRSSQAREPDTGNPVLTVRMQNALRGIAVKIENSWRDALQAVWIKHGATRQAIGLRLHRMNAHDKSHGRPPCELTGKEARDRSQ